MMAAVGRRRCQRNAKRRTEAINFLANISLDGSIVQTQDSPVKAQVKNESRGEKGADKIAPEKRERLESRSNLCVEETTETDGGGGASETALSTGANEGFSPMSPDPRGRTRSSASKTASAGVSSASLRLKHSFSSEKGPLLIPTLSKRDTGSRPPRAQTQVLSAEDLTKHHSQQGVTVTSQILIEGTTHKHHHHHHGLHHHHRHHTTPATSLSTDTEHVTALAPSSDRPTVYTGVVHIVHSLPQHQAKPSRMLMVSSSKVPFSLYSILPYSRRSQHGLLRNDSDGITAGRTRKSSGTRGVGSDVHVLGLAGDDLGDGVKEVSYRHLLVPAKDQAAYRRQHSLDVLSSPHSPAMRKIPGHPLTLQWERGDSEGSSHDLNANHYDPMELDDPGLHAGKHTKVLTFPSYMVSILDYTKPSELKKNINQKFKERFPHIDLSLSKLRSIKREMRRIAIDAGTMDMLALAHAYVYYEKLVLCGKISKDNRKLCAGACLTLASKLNDTKGAELQTHIKEIEDTFRENRKDFLQLEFPILVALEFSLHLPESVVLPHYRRIAQLT